MCGRKVSGRIASLAVMLLASAVLSQADPNREPCFLLFENSQCEFDQDLPIVTRTHSGLKHLRRVLRRVVDSELVEHDFVIVVFERPGRWQDHVRVSRRLVDVEIDRTEEIQSGQSAIDRDTTWRR